MSSKPVTLVDGRETEPLTGLDIEAIQNQVDLYQAAIKASATLSPKEMVEYQSRHVVPRESFLAATLPRVLGGLVALQSRVEVLEKTLHLITADSHCTCSETFLSRGRHSNDCRWELRNDALQALGEPEDDPAELGLLEPAAEAEEKV